MGLHSDGDSLGGFMKDGGSLTLDAWSQPIMGYTLIAARAGQPSIWVFTLMATLGGLPERRRLAHVGCSEPAYNGIYPDGGPCRSTAYMGLHPDSHPWGVPEIQRLAHIGCSELAYNGIYPDGRPSRSTNYMGLHHDGNSSGAS